MASMLGNTEMKMQSPDGMTVFGFGRGEGVTSYLRGRQSFVIGFYPEKIDHTSGHHEFSEFVQNSYLNN